MIGTSSVGIKSDMRIPTWQLLARIDQIHELQKCRMQWERRLTTERNLGPWDMSLSDADADGLAQLSDSGAVAI